ncbi:MAG: TonB-dependent receptor plug domain-containing protein, partial [Proteobacteria bacterium]|nr:TonB-dependent receptor plug domain-containing protein [Pseudomonadota bacterium]
MSTRMVAMAPAVALACVTLGASAVLAQDAGGTTTAQPATPPNQTTANPSGQPPAQAPSSGAPNTALPEVQVIQEQPKPKPVKQAAKPKKAPVAQVQAPTTPPVEEGSSVLEPTQVKMSPVGGSEIPIAKVPGSVGTVSSSDVTRSGTMAVQDALQSRIPGVIVNNLQGNDFQTNVQFHGFEASQVDRVPQRLHVYGNGVRINAAFGDV